MLTLLMNACQKFDLEYCKDAPLMGLICTFTKLKKLSFILMIFLSRVSDHNPCVNPEVSGLSGSDIIFHACLWKPFYHLQHHHCSSSFTRGDFSCFKAPLKHLLLPPKFAKERHSVLCQERKLYSFKWKHIGWKAKSAWRPSAWRQL